MSRQFQLFLHPKDVEKLMIELRHCSGLRMMKHTSPTPEPIELTSPLCDPSSWENKPGVGADCYLVPARGGELRTRYYPTQSHWHLVLDDSDAIEFSACYFNGEILVRGRFYFQTTVLRGDACPKSKESLKWADLVFRQRRSY